MAKPVAIGLGFVPLVVLLVVWCVLTWGAQVESRIVTSLILFEHVFGLVGLFLSFPSLYVAAKIIESWRHESSAHEDELRTARQLRMEAPE